MVFLYFYGNYTRSQEQMTPSFQRFRAWLKQTYAGGVLPDSLRSEFRAGSLPLMKYANILTFNTRAIVLYLSLLAGHPWFYFAFELVVMNILFLYMRNRHEALCRRMQQQYC